MKREWNQSHQQTTLFFLRIFMVFFLSGGLILLYGYFLARYLLPSDIRDSSLTFHLQTDPPSFRFSWYQYLREHIKREEKIEKRVRGSKALSPLVFQSKQGYVVTYQDKDQAKLRQQLLILVMNSEEKRENPSECWKRLNAVPGDGPWRSYEIHRAYTRVLSSAYDYQRDPNILREYRDYALRAIQSPYHNFEDLFFAGRAQLYTGYYEEAEQLLLDAQKQWPPVSNIYYGYLQLFLHCIQAIKNQEEVIDEILEFSSYFSDWKNPEIYEPELEEIKRCYPHKPLLDVIHGRIWEILGNPARATQLYQKALRSPSLPQKVREKVIRLILSLSSFSHRKGE